MNDSLERYLMSFFMGLAAGALVIAGTVLMGVSDETRFLGEAMLGAAGICLLIGSQF